MTTARKFGLDFVGDIPWGAHLCQFYDTKHDLIDIFVPYFAEGLRNNEACVWEQYDIAAMPKKKNGKVQQPEL
jgi:hypothetical protein